MDLHQNGWRGGFGVLLGVRSHPDMPSGFVAQGFLFRVDRKIGGGRMSLRRAQLVFIPDSNGEYRVQYPEKYDSIISKPLQPSESFELEITSGSLNRIRWNGLDVAALRNPEINSQFEPSDHLGTIGIYLEESDATVSSLEIMRLSNGE